MDAHGGVRGAGSTGNEADARLPGQLAVGFGHMRRAGFVPGVDQAKAVLHVV